MRHHDGNLDQILYVFSFGGAKSLANERRLIGAGARLAVGASGGYVAGSKELISQLRLKCHSSVYAESMSPPVLTQIIASIASIMGPECLEVCPTLDVRLDSRLIEGSEGRDRLRRLAFNSRYLGTGLRKLGFIIYGNRDAPIVPLLLFTLGKVRALSYIWRWHEVDGLMWRLGFRCRRSRA